MGERKGQRLYVNLPASQVRRRLKGFGHGVRKVQSAGRNQALVIHTASGEHLRELLGLFADTRAVGTPGELGTAIEELRNLGPASGHWLREAGITTTAELRRLGPILAYRLVKQRAPRVSLNLLWSLVAGLEDRDWRSLTDEEKQGWLAELEDGSSDRI